MYCGYRNLYTQNGTLVIIRELPIVTDKWHALELIQAKIARGEAECFIFRIARSRAMI